MTRKRTERSFTDELPALLAERGLTLREVARRSGVDHGHLSRLLRGVGYRSRPSVDLARRVAVALGLPPDYFREYREGIVVEEVRNDPRLREELYARFTDPKRPSD